MVSFIPAGRMGNFLFEAACTIGYSLDHGLNFSIPSDTSNHTWSPLYLHHLQSKDFNPNLQKIEIQENGHEYQEIPFEESWRDKNIIILGYRQSEKYFSNYRNEILYLFDYPWEQKQFVSIHIRRTDYLALKEKHPPFSEEYMRCATSRFYLKGLDHFKVFSDDIPWCKEYFKDSHYSAMKIEFSNNTNEVDDLIEGSCGMGHINSSSTFSWWMAWLNRNKEKIIYTPRMWFVDNYHLNTKDIIPDEWIKI